MTSPRLRLVLLALLAVVLAHASDVIDRIVATVNGRVILQSDWDDAVCYEAFAEARSLDQITPADRKAALDRLIDQELLREQMPPTEIRATAKEIQKRVQEIRQKYSGADEAAWGATLQRYGLTEKELEARVALQLDVMRLVDARLRPTIQIDSRSIESYYQETLIPQLRQAGSKEVPLAEVTPKIKELLTQQKMNQLLVAWLQNLRAESNIRTSAGASDSEEGQAR
jgi:parvulin-like peptidyl-prolyl isomerase